MDASLSRKRQLLDAVHAHAARNRGFITTRILVAIGLTERQIRSWCASGLLRHIARGVYHVSLQVAQLDRDHWANARLLAAGDDAVLDGPAALEYLGGTRFRYQQLDILVPSRRSVTFPGTNIRTLACLDELEVRETSGMCALAPAPLLARLGTDLGGYQWAHAIHQVQHHHPEITAERVEQELERYRHFGAANVRAGLRLHRSSSAGTRSRTEDRYVGMALRSHRTPPLVNTVYSLFERTVEVDIFYPREMVRVEIKGGHHGRLHDAAVDHVRDIDFTDSGITVISEDWRDVWRDIAGCRRRLLAALHSTARNRPRMSVTRSWT